MTPIVHITPKEQALQRENESLLQALRISSFTVETQAEQIDKLKAACDKFSESEMLLKAQPVQPAPLKGWKLVPIEPTPEIVAAAAIAVWPTASQADIDLARKAAPIVLMQSDLGPGFTVESLAAGLATMAPAYRAMIAAAPTTGEPT